MKVSATLSRYIGLLYFRNTMLLLLALLSIIYLFDTVELLRRASKFESVPLSLVMKMGLLKLPEVGQILFPFAILFGAMFTFWQLNRRHELVVCRSAGFSVWQVLTPVLTTALFIGVVQVGAINPVGALLLSKYDQLERSYLTRNDSQIAIFKEGVWLRQGFVHSKGAPGRQDGYVIFHADKIQQTDWRLNSVTVLYFDQDDSFLQRLDADNAVLERGRWLFNDVVLHNPEGKIERHDSYMLGTELTIEDVQDSFASPGTMSFWQLPSYIKVLEETGFDASSLRVHYHSLLAQPFLFVAMVLLAATVSMRPPRLRGGLILFSAGVFMGFVVFFMSSFLQALGASHQIPVILSAWAPALICLMLGVSIIINLEDG